MRNTKGPSKMVTWAKFRFLNSVKTDMSRSKPVNIWELNMHASWVSYYNKVV